jgi:hypothetical protein
VTPARRYEGPDGRIHNIRESVAAATKGAPTADPLKVNVGPPTYDNLVTMSKRDLKALLIRVCTSRVRERLDCRAAVFSCCFSVPRKSDRSAQELRPALPRSKPCEGAQ